MKPLFKHVLIYLCFLIFSASSFVQTHAQSMILDSLTGPVTQNEINAFKVYMTAKVQAPASNDENVWVYGNPGKAIEACGMMYEASHDVAILDRMVYYCDAALAGRNDLASAANGGQRMVWSGNIEPVWPSSDDGVVPAGAGIEQGEVLSHMAFCSMLILQNPSLWNLTVPDGDPKGYGITYKQRAIKYIQEGDYVLDTWIMPRFIRTSDENHYYFPGAPNTYKPNEPAPWNQAFMLTNSFVRLTQCHLLLNDEPQRIAKYDSIVRPNLKWFFDNLSPNISPSGSACWIWAYALPTGTEDANHFAYDAQGLYIAYATGRYGIKFSDLVPFANTYTDVILAIVTNGIYAGKVDGTTGTGNSGGDNYVRDEYIYLTEFRPDKYIEIGNIEIAKNKIASSPQITGRLLWEKNRRYRNALPSVTVPPAQAVILTPLNNASLMAGDVNLRWTGSNNTTNYKIYVGTDTMNLPYKADVSSQSYLVTGLPLNIKYYWRIDAQNVVGTIAGKYNSFTLSLAPAADSLSNINRITGNGGTLTAQYESSKPTESYIYLNDLNTATKYFVSKTALWVHYKSTQSKGVAYYTIASANDVPTRDPKNWQLLGSTDSITWTIIDTRTNEIFAGRRSVKFYSVTNTNPYIYFKLNITANNGATATQFSEWNMYYVVDAPLPLSMVYFNAIKLNKYVRLDWRTAAEKNTNYFELLKSKNGIDFETVGKVDASGESTTQKNYYYLDKDPFTGPNYYKLLQHDKDGKFVEIGTRVVNVAMAQQWNVYPNPAKDFFHIDFKNHVGHVEIQLVDAVGRTVHQQAKQLTGGDGSIFVQFNKKLIAGKYYLRITGKGINEVQALNIQ